MIIIIIIIIIEAERSRKINKYGWLKGQVYVVKRKMRRNDR